MRPEFPWLIQVIMDEENHLMAEVKRGDMEIAVLTLDPWPEAEDEPIVEMVSLDDDPDESRRFNVFWRSETVTQNREPSSDIDFGFMVAQAVSFSIDRVWDKYGVE